MDLQAEIALLRAEVESLKAQCQMAGDAARVGFGPDMGLPIAPVGGGAPQGAFRWEDGKITNCYFMFGREVYSLEDVANATAEGTWSLVIPHATPTQASVVRNTSEYTNLTKTVVPLFRVVNGEVTQDWRGMPVVPVRE